MGLLQTGKELQTLSWRLQHFTSLIHLVKVELRGNWKRFVNHVQKNKRLLNRIYCQLTYQFINEEEAIEKLILEANDMCKTASNCLNYLAHKNKIVEQKNGSCAQIRMDSVGIVQAGMCCSILQLILQKANNIEFQTHAQRLRMQTGLMTIECLLKNFEEKASNNFLLSDKYALLFVHIECLRVLCTGINIFVKP